MANNKIDTLDLLAKLVSINSIFPHEQELSTFVTNLVSKMGMSVKTITTGNDRKNIIATFGKAKKYLTFYAHLDTVPQSVGWKQDPFKLAIKSGRAIGLGAGDVKNGISSSIVVASYAIEQNLPVQLIFTVDEENISQGAHDVIDGKTDLKIGLIVSTESGQIKDYSKKYSVVFGRLGRAVIDIVIHGQTVHAAESERGINAITEATKIIGYIEKITLPSDPHLGKSRLMLQKISSETSSYSVPDTCTMQYSYLSNPKLSTERLMAKIRDILKAHKVKGVVTLHDRPTPYGESYKLNRKDLFIQKLITNIFEKDDVTPTYAQSVGDENIFANRLGVPVIVIGPMRDNAHKAEEWVDINSLNKCVEVYKKILEMYSSKL